MGLVVFLFGISHRLVKISWATHSALGRLLNLATAQLMRTTFGNSKRAIRVHNTHTRNLVSDNRGPMPWSRMASLACSDARSQTLRIFL